MDKKEERRLLKLAKPVVKIYLEIDKLNKEKERKKVLFRKRNDSEDKKNNLQKEIKNNEKKLIEEKKKLKKINRENIEAVRSLLNYNQKLVKYIVPGYYLSNKFVTQEELISEGTFSLLKAIDKFDLVNSKNRFSTYAVIWIKTYVTNFINYKSGFINQSPLTKERKNVVYYESNKVDDDSEKKENYSLSETLEEEENYEKINKEDDLMKEISNLINSLNEPDSILIIRLEYKILPVNLLDIYFLLKEPEKKKLLKKLNIKEPIEPIYFRNYSLEKCRNFSLVKKYKKIFSSSYGISELAKFLEKKENEVIKLKKEILQKFQKLARESSLSSFL